ncbi:TRAPP trafficking subunit Trs65-domain-containing protein [Limtongia smithiae]|uniref:TRAPP trafficking subunit Trs65-domain-containing protein n=1 Tax=Limtongia smithiae TaxID=1125753 RepID=UPI0034CFC1B2
MAPARTSVDLLASGELNVLVPDVASAAIDSSRDASNDPAAHGALASLPRRSLLFFDETVPVYIRLRLGATGITRAQFNAYLSRLVIAVDVSVANMPQRYSSLGISPQQIQQQYEQQQQNQTTSPVFLSALDRSALVLVQKMRLRRREDDAECPVWIALWRVVVPVARPRMNLSYPRVIINARVSLRSKAADSTSQVVWRNSVNIKSDTDSDHERGSRDSKRDGTANGGEDDEDTSNGDNDDSSGGMDDFVRAIDYHQSAAQDFLMPYAPLQSVNLFECLAQDVVFGKHPLNLPASKVLPPTPPATATSSTRMAVASTVLPPELIRLPRLATGISLSVFQCIAIRVSCTRLSTAVTLSARDDVPMFVSLDVDVPDKVNVDVVIESVELAVGGGKTERLQYGSDSNAGIKFPVRCRPAGGISDIFKVYPLSTVTVPPSSDGTGSTLRISTMQSSPQQRQQEQPTQPKDLQRTVTVTVEYTPILRRLDNDDIPVTELDFGRLGPAITTVWSSTIDFAMSAGAGSHSATTLAPPSVAALQQAQQGSQTLGFRSVSGQSSAAWQQMMQLRSLSNTSQSYLADTPSTPGLWSPAAAGPHRHASQPLQPQEALREIVHEGLSLTFTGPTEVRAGEVFTWRVFITNRSRSVKRISLIVQPKKWTMNNLKSLPREPAPPQPLTSRASTLRSEALIMDETALYAAHLAGMVEADELISLVNDVRIGPLAPGASHETALKLVGLGIGVLSLDSVRVVDLSKGEGFDCTNLMNVICRRG